LVEAVLEGLPTVRLVQAAAVLSGQVPYGLFFMIVVAYALGASAISRQGALVQQVNAIESLSNIDILCTDKTGTLTANRMLFHEVYPLNGATPEAVKAQLGDFGRSASSGNLTSEAIIAGTSGTQCPVVDEVAFASARKWSALAFGETADHRPATAGDGSGSSSDLTIASGGQRSAGSGQSLRGVYVLGAVEMLSPYLPLEVVGPESPLSQQLQSWSEQGLRVLLFAHNPQVTRLHNGDGQPELPPLTPLALVSLSDELRPQVKETIAAFRQLGIELKVISGDNPQSVAALAKQAGFPPEVKLVSGPALTGMSQAEFDQAAAETTIFGRITPEQKE
jgi:cation-transporting ATPase E